MSKLVSVIIPVYNVQEYLKRCLNSVINQSYSNIEIIIVNDGSTDNSNEICKNFESKDKRIKLINKENEGLSLARKTGFNNAKGEYILFIDSDDFINEEYLENMMKQIKDCDVILANVIYSYDDYKRELVSNLDEKNSYSSKAIIKKMILNKEIKDFTWGNLYKKELIKEEYFTASRVFEDIEFTHRVILNSNKIGYSKKSIYNYVQRQNSLLASGFNESKLHLFKATEFMINNINKKYPDLRCELEYRYITSLLMIIIPILRENLDKDYKYKECYAECSSILKSLNVKNRFLSKKHKAYMLLNKLGCLKIVYKLISR